MKNWNDIEQMLLSGNFQAEIGVEYKEAKNDVPKSFWESYSAFANQSGGFILLGVAEKEKNKFEISGVNKSEQIKDLIFSQSRSQKVSVSLLNDDDVKVFDIRGKQVVATYIRRAEINERPVHLNQDYRLSYIRLNTGDHKLTDSELRSFLSSYSKKDEDGRILPFATLEHLNLGTLNKYRNLLKAHNPNSSLLTLSDQDLIERIGVFNYDVSANQAGITYAGLLLFGKGNVIKSVFKHFFFEYYEKSEQNNRYDLRITDFDLDDGNLFEFYLKVSPLITALGKDNHFKLDNLTRTEENEITDALREALVNAIAHADYFNDVRHLKIVKTQNQISFENAGVMLVDVGQAIQGNRSECRNGTLHNILRRIGLCERQGQGVRDIFEHWQGRYFTPPKLESQIDYTKLTLTFHDGEIANWAENLTACFGATFTKLKNVPKDCLLFIAVNGQQASHKQIVEGIPQYTGREITLALAQLKNKGFLAVTGEKRLDRIYLLTELVKTKSNFDYDRIKTTTNHNEPLNHQGEAVVSYSHSLGKVQVNDQAPPLVTPLATPLARLVQVLGNDEKGIVQLAEDLSITDKKHIRKTYIAPALKQALIEMTIPDKTTSPNQNIA
ncbi:Divergent AAA domain [Actinobacillus pleuropneumoniae]|nr:Divergent AAA domain [Actinobacillus pleuropneumoniae]